MDINGRPLCDMGLNPLSDILIREKLLLSFESNRQFAQVKNAISPVYQNLSGGRTPANANCKMFFSKFTLFPQAKQLGTSLHISAVRKRSGKVLVASFKIVT